MTSRTPVLTTLALLFVALAASALPLAAAQERCVETRGLATLCQESENGRGCVWTTAPGPAVATSHVSAKHCTHLYQVDGVTYLCADTIAGTWGRVGTNVVAADECVAHYEWDTAQCFVAWGTAGSVTWYTEEPVCAVEPIPLA